MRSVPQDFLTGALAAVRQVSAQANFRDTRLLFTSREISETADPVSAYDHDVDVAQVTLDPSWTTTAPLNTAVGFPCVVPGADLDSNWSLLLYSTQKCIEQEPYSGTKGYITSKSDPSSSFNRQYWNVEQFPNDAEVFIGSVMTKSSVGDLINWAWLYLGLSGSMATPESIDGYALKLTGFAAGKVKVQVYRLDNGVPNQIGTDITGQNSPAYWCLRRRGNFLEVWRIKDTGIEHPELVQTIEDSTYTSGGYAGFALRDLADVWIRDIGFGPCDETSSGLTYESPALYDDFNRADEDPLDGDKWQTDIPANLTDYDLPAYLSDHVVPSPPDSTNPWMCVLDNVAADSFIEFELSTWKVLLTEIRLSFRAVNNVSHTDLLGYTIDIWGNGGVTEWDGPVAIDIYRAMSISGQRKSIYFANGIFPTPLFDITSKQTQGMKFGLEQRGHVFKLYYRLATDTGWHLLYRINDWYDTYPDDGLVALSSTGETEGDACFDNVRIGDVPATEPEPGSPTPITHIIRAVNDQGDLKYAIWTDPSSSYLDPFIDTGVDVAPEAGVGLSDTGRLWYVSGSGVLQHMDWSGSSWGAPVTALDALDTWGTTVLSLAPVDSRCYVQVGPLESPLAHSLIVEVDPNGVILSEFHGAIYGDPSSRQRFDAVPLGDRDVIFIVDRESGRCLYTTKIGQYYSELRHVVPLDVVDDTSSFSLGGVEVINNLIFVTGRLKRGNISMDVYLMSPDGDHFSMGRDLFVTADFVLDYVGKMIYTEDYGVVAYIGFGGLAWAPATHLVGYDNAKAELLTQEIASISISQAANASSTLEAEITASLDDAVVRRGAQVEVQAIVGGSSALLGTFGVDVLSRSQDEGGEGGGLGGRGWGMRQMDLWESDQSYDLWSQTKSVFQPHELSNIVNATGCQTASGSSALTSGSAALTVDELNVDGWFYSVERAVRGALMRAMFISGSTSGFTGRYGVGTNYYRESRYEAAARLGLDSEAVTEGQYGTYGLFALVEDLDVSVVKFWQGVEEELVAPTPLGISGSSPFWLQMIFQDGRINVDIKEQGSTGWTRVVDSYLYQGDVEPWFRDDRGRGAIYLRNKTAYSTTYGFDSTLDIVPVVSVASFPDAETVTVDGELIEYTGRATPGTNLGDMTVVDGQNYAQANHTNSLWTGGMFRSIHWVTNHAGDARLGYNLDECMYLGQAFRGPYGRDRVDKIRVVAKKVGTPTHPLYCYFVLDAYDDTGPPWYTTYVIMSASCSQANVGSNYGWIEFDFTGVSENLRWLNTAYGKSYWIIITPVPPGTNPTGWQDASNYYYVKIDTVSVTDAPGIFLYWGDQYDWARWNAHHPTDAMMPFEIYGISNAGDGYPVFVSGSGPVLARSYFDDCALYVVSGPGQGSTFKITDFDYNAPDEWVPNQTYAEPDKWQDHVGVPSHGDWLPSDKKRIFVHTNPSGIIAAGSVVRIVPALTGATRGTGEISASAHALDTLVSVYRNDRVACLRGQFFSTDTDMRVEDTLREIAAKSGVMEFEAEMEQDLRWDLFSGSSPACELYPRHRNAIIKIGTVPGAWPATNLLGAIFRADTGFTSGSSAYTEAYRILADHDGLLTLSLYNGSWSDLEQYQMPYAITGGMMTISVQNNAFSVWFNDQLAYVFVDETLTEGDYAGPYAVIGEDMQAQVDFSVADRRVDNFILDMGTRGTQLAADVIGTKRLVFLDSPGGGVRLARRRVGGDADYTTPAWAVGAATSAQDGDVRTVIRVEGIEVVEVADYATMKVEGFLFRMSDAPESNDIWEVEQEAQDYMDDITSAAESLSVGGPCDPRLEPNDVIDVPLPGTTERLIVDQVSITIDASKEDDAMFDATVEARRAIE